MRKRRLKIAKMVILLLSCVLLTASGDFLWSLTVKWLNNTSWGRLQSIEVRGIERIPRDLIVDSAKLPFGISLFYYPFEKAANNITDMPGVKKTECFRRVPGKLIIKVVERKPIMAIALKQITLMDIDCVNFYPIGTFETIDVPFLTSTDKVFRRTDIEQAQNLLISIYRNHETLYKHLSEIRSSKSSLSIILREGGAEVVQKDELNEDHLEILDAFLGQKSTTLPSDLKYVDLRFEKMVIIGTDKKDV